MDQPIIALVPLFIIFLIEYWILGSKLSRIRYSGFLWTIRGTFGGIVAFPLATSLPDRRIEARRPAEERLLDRQLRQASLPVIEGELAIPRETISDDLTRAGEG